MEKVNRPLRFRAWDEKKKVMHFDFQFIRSGIEGNDWIIFISDKFPLENHKTNPFRNPSPYFAQQLKIMQYTGLKDKNGKGKEIYEGDLLRDRNGNIRDVHWSDKEAGWCSKCLSDTGHHPEFDNERISYGWLITKGCEVIGNIYEHAHLLKEAK